MPGFFEALEKFKDKAEKKHFVTIEGQSLQVDLSKKLEIQRVGESNYFCQKGPNGAIICRKPNMPPEQRQPQLVESSDGIKFYENNPFWPTTEGDKTFKWQIK